MLTYIRSNAQSFGVKLAFLLIILVFVFWGVGTFNDGNTVNVVAKVNNELILVQDFEQAYRNAEEQTLRDSPGTTREQLKNEFLGRQVLQELVMQALITQEAARVGITVTALELRQLAEQEKAFQDANGRFDAEAYKQVLAAQRISLAAYEQNLRKTLLRQKIYAMVVAPAWADPSEAQHRYNFLREKRMVDYLFIPAKNFSAKFTPSEMPSNEEIQAYYESRKQDFVIAPKVAMEYVIVDPAGFKNSDDKVRDVLDALLEDNILGKPLDENAARFALKTARTGLLTREELVAQFTLKPDGAQALFAVGAGAPVDVALESGENYLVCKLLAVEPSATRSLEAVKNDIVTALTAEKALTAALANAAARRGDLLDMPVAPLRPARKKSMGIVSAPPMERGGQLADFAPDAELAEAVFAARPNVWLPTAFAVNSAKDGPGALLCRVENILAPDPKEWENLQGLMTSIVERERTEGYFQFFVQNLFARAKIEVVNQGIVDRADM
ncbi:MAG: peptidylprolyl isomerase [Desulfovibrio sp.]|jgi:hypothetical protein|nr:peptidylprolyl isomerase [Desulfovibrio sp.]